ncbi:hypothetical protein J6590_031060 [Homalodisca vitripennis]|nr:hypothetical protein J6590_031060 [Homalodisca vitripennis]
MLHNVVSPISTWTGHPAIKICLTSISDNLWSCLLSLLMTTVVDWSSSLQDISNQHLRQPVVTSLSLLMTTVVDWSSSLQDISNQHLRQPVVMSLSLLMTTVVDWSSSLQDISNQHLRQPLVMSTVTAHGHRSGLVLQ